MISKRKNAQTKIYGEIRDKISSDDINSAEELLDLVPYTERGAEWHFLKGCALTHSGWFHDAQTHFEKAITLEPDNAEYAEAVKSLTESANEYRDTWSDPQKTETPNKEKNKREKNFAGCLKCCAEGFCECICEGICEGCDGI